MKLFIIAVRDRAVDAFGTPFFVQALGQGVRSFKDEINNVGSPFANHPDDYDLYHIGYFDTDTGTVMSIDAERPEMIAIGKSLVNKE